MLADGHRNAAENIEATIALLGASPRAARLIIEGAWGAAFHWIAFGCETKHGKHQESHARQGTFLRSLGEMTVAGRLGKARPNTTRWLVRQRARRHEGRQRAHPPWRYPHMGDNLIHEAASERIIGEVGNISLTSWLDAQSSALVRDIVATLAQRYPNLLAIVLFGSVARHDERPLTDPQPSDVDLLAIFDTDEDPVHLPRGLDITHTIGLARNRHLDAPREVQVMFTTRAMREWDTTFIANVARDGIVLWARGPLPQPLSAMERTPAHRW